jgi:AraC-like DNA-binding protein
MRAESCAVHIGVVATGSVATVGTFAHGAGWCGDPDEEVFTTPTAIVTTAGTWGFHGRHGFVDADERVVVLGHRGESYRCTHPCGPTDRTLFVDVHADYELPAASSVARHRSLDGVLAALSGAGEPLRVDALALTLLAALHDLPPDAPRLDPRRRRVVADACDHLERNYDRNLTLAELAGAVHVSPFHLHRLFRTVTGVTPLAYVTEIRVERARELLRAGWSVAEVAPAVGYASPGHFARVFRARTGVNPSVYAGLM